MAPADRAIKMETRVLEQTKQGALHPRLSHQAAQCRNGFQPRRPGAISQCHLDTALRPSGAVFATNSGHEETKISLARMIRKALPCDLPVEDHKDPICQTHDLGQIHRNEQHGDTSVPEIPKTLIDSFGGADVDPPRWLLGDQAMAGHIDFTGDDGFLDVAPGQTRYGNIGVIELDIVLLDLTANPFPNCFQPDERPIAKRRPIVGAHDHILGNACLPCTTLAVAIVGNMPDPQRSNFAVLISR